MFSSPQLTDTGTFICFATGRYADLAGAEVSVYLLVEQRECKLIYLLSIIYFYYLFIKNVILHINSRQLQHQMIRAKYILFMLSRCGH